MAERISFDHRLRQEYDVFLLDRKQRQKQAVRIRRLLKGRGLWADGARILDVGCGAGLTLYFLRDDSCRLAVGCDIRRELFLQCRRDVRDIVFIQAGGEALPFPDGSFDLVTCISVVEEFPDVTGAFREMARCLAPGGILYITVTNGRFLAPVYRLIEAVGGTVRQGWKQYAANGRKIMAMRPDKNFLVDDTLRFQDLTTPLVRQEIPLLRLAPSWLLAPGLRWFSPTHVYCWTKPGGPEDAPCAE